MSCLPSCSKECSEECNKQCSDSGLNASTSPSTEKSDCRKETYCLAIKIYKGVPGPTYLSKISINVAIFWDNEAKKHASDRCNLYVVPRTRTFLWMLWKKKLVEVIEVPITEAEYKSSMITLFIWSDPPATATFREIGDVAVGRLKLTESKVVHRGPPARESSFDNEILFEAEIVESPVFHLINIMHANQSHPAVEDMRHWSGGKKADVMTNLGFPAELKGGLIDKAWSTFGDPSYAENKSEFDLKPKFRPNWGTRNRIENNARVYYYDVWSNLHYGFIGNAAGFSAEELNKLASQDPRGDRIADKHATTAGWKIYQSLPTNVRDGTLPAKQNALYEKILSAVRGDDLFLDKGFYDECK